MNTKYFNKVQETLKLVDDTEANSLSSAKRIIANTLDNEGIIYIFGCGHSHMFGEENFYRAGGLACVCPILYEPLMLHLGAAQSSVNEKKNDYIDNFINDYNFSDNDCIIVVSTSGINPVPIDVALHCKAKGIKVITITSKVYKQKEDSRHKDGLYLCDIGNVNIDNHVVYGDALFNVSEMTFGPISTVVGMSIIHSFIIDAILELDDDSLSIFRSGNIKGSATHNKELVDKYKEKIPMLGLNLEN